MKLTWRPRAGQSGSALVLGDDALGFRSAGSKFILSAGPTAVQFISEAVAYPRAEEIATFGRGNAQTSYAALIDYQFATVGACSQFLHRIGTDLDGAGVLEVTHDGGGQDSMEAICTAIQRVQRDGAMLVLSYTFLGGLFTKGPASNLVPIT